MPKPPPISPSFAANYDSHVACPRCGSADTRVTSPFGGTVSEMLFQCEACGDSFGWMKWEHRTSDRPGTPKPVRRGGDPGKGS